MGLLIDGKWSDQWYDTKKTGGKFLRQQSTFRNKLDTPDFPVEDNRYILYVSYACPWAHRVLIYRHLKGLKEILPVINVDPLMGPTGWSLKKNLDQYNNKDHMYQIYTLADPQYTGRVTVPVLWDIKKKTIVNNESSDIIRMLNSVFNDMTGNRLDLFPTHLASSIDEMNQFLYENINNGVYKVGFSTKQEVYNKEVRKLFNALDHIENILTHQRYLVGNEITESDWRLFTTLVRFDAVYVGHFKCNIRRIIDYPHIRKYMSFLYNYEGVKDTVRMEEIKTHYYLSHPTINPSGIIPSGPEMIF